MLQTGIYFGFSVITLFFFIYAKVRYSQEINEIPSKEYKIKPFIGMGLWVLDHRPKRLQTDKIIYPIRQIYGRQEYHKRARIYRAQKITLFLLFIWGTFLLAGILRIQAKPNVVQDVIQRASFGEGDTRETINYVIDVDGEQVVEQIEIEIPQMRPTQQEIDEFLLKVAEQLPSIIKGNNKSLDYVTQPLNLITTYDNTILKIQWYSENTQILTDDGQIRKNNLMTDQVVTLTAELRYGKNKREVQFDVHLFPYQLSTQEKIDLTREEIKRQLSEDVIRDSDQRIIQLPKALDALGVQLRWFKTDGNIKPTTLIFLGLFFSISLYWLQGFELKRRLTDRQGAILRDFPNWVSQFSLLLNAGMTFRRAFEKIAADYQTYEDEIKPIYEEMLITIEDMQKGVPEIKAYEDFAHRCDIAQVLRFFSAVIQNIKKGGSVLQMMIEQQAKEAWLMRQDEAKKKGEKASTRLVFPMGILLFAVILLIITPAFISLNI